MPDPDQLATRVILDRKDFVKEWPFRDEMDQLLWFICRVMPGLSILKTELTKELPYPRVSLSLFHSMQHWVS